MKGFVNVRGRETKKARIEIVPMIDAIFFLLVFFMMSSLQSITMSAPRVKLPVSTLDGAKPLNKVVVSIDKNGSYFIDKQQVEFDDILPMLKERIDRDEDLSVILNADSGQLAGQLLALYDKAKQARPAKIYIATAPNDSAPAETPSAVPAGAPAQPGATP